MSYCSDWAFSATLPYRFLSTEIVGSSNFVSLTRGKGLARRCYRGHCVLSCTTPPECIIMSENTNVSVACLITIPGYAESDRNANGIIWLEANVARHLNNLIERLSDIFEAQVSTISNSIFFSFFNIFYKKDFLRKLFGNACSGRRSRMQVFLGV